MKRCLLIACVALLALAGCSTLRSLQPTNAQRPLQPLPPLVRDTGVAPPRINGNVGSTRALPPAEIHISPSVEPRGTVAAPTVPGAGTYQLDFADTDIREVVAQILGNMLMVNYTIDPAVHGTVTLRTAQPLNRSQLIPTLEMILAQNGAALVESDGVYRVTTAAAGSTVIGGTTVVPLRYASADELAKMLQPYAQGGTKILAETGGNAVVVSGEPAARDALAGLVQAFDIDVLAGQSYALFPVDGGDASDFATALQTALKSKEGGALANVVRVVPMSRMNAVLVVAPSPRYVEDAQRVYALVARNRRLTTRSWTVHYLQNSRANDVAYLLQEAFTPNAVTAQPTPSGPGATAPGQGAGTVSGATGGAGGIGGVAGLGTGTSGGGLLGGGGSTAGTLGTAGGTAGGLGGGLRQAQPAAQAPTGNPLLGGLGGAAPGGGAEAGTPETMRIIPDLQNNSVLIYGTPQETATVEAMLHKVDILPLQVRIDAVIAEVDLNDNLQYGTQFFFNQGINAALSQGTAANTFQENFPGFILGAHSSKGFAITALQAVTKVRVLSSPQLLVLDNQPARIQVGDLVPYLTQSSQSTLVAGAPVVNSVDYRETGVIMEVTPRVNSSGLVTLDIAQEVSGIDTAATASSQIQSPTFTERAVQSRVVVQDGQTVGLAGLISDTSSRGNSGIPWIKDVPILGLLAGSQSNIRARTELLVLLTPHVMKDQRDARALTEDLRETLGNAARVNEELRNLPPTGSNDPGAPLRHRLDLSQ
jgi:general secretion pathway protein D